MTKKYGETESESQAQESFRCRQIVSEIMNFGVSQSQVLQIIKLLSLELENRSHMKMLTKTCEDIKEGKIIEEGSKILL